MSGGNGVVKRVHFGGRFTGNLGRNLLRKSADRFACARYSGPFWPEGAGCIVGEFRVSFGGLVGLDLLVALVVILLLMWLLGVSFAASVGSFIHLLLVVVILVVFRLVRGQSLSL